MRLEVRLGLRLEVRLGLRLGLRLGVSERGDVSKAWERGYVTRVTCQ